MHVVPFFLMVSVFWSSGGIGGCVIHDSSLNQFLAQIRNMDIVSIKLDWFIQKDTGQIMKTVYETRDNSECSSIKNAILDIEVHNDNSKSVVNIVAIGLLSLSNNEGEQKKIDITDYAFFRGHRRSLSASFYSEKLAYIIESMLKKSRYKEQIILPDKIFERLTGKLAKKEVDSNMF